MAFTSDERLNKEVDARNSKSNTVSLELHRLVVIKRELSNTANLSLFKSVRLSNLTCVHGSFLSSERIIFQVQTTGW